MNRSIQEPYSSVSVTSIQVCNKSYCVYWRNGIRHLKANRTSCAGAYKQSGYYHSNTVKVVKNQCHSCIEAYVQKSIEASLSSFFFVRNRKSRNTLFHSTSRWHEINVVIILLSNGLWFRNEVILPNWLWWRLTASLQCASYTAVPVISKQYEAQLAYCITTSHVCGIAVLSK